MDLEKFKSEAANRARENKKFLGGLKKKNPRELDQVFHKVHDSVFEETDCLQCANCCKTTSPIFYPHDIERLSKALRLRPADFIEKYLRVDEDRDYVLRSSPCPFLQDDNYCSVYDNRPKACREYPHTDRKKIFQIMDLTYKNTMVCPAVLKIVDRVRQQLDEK
jgi:Fe-S-cluster containining protein